MKLCSAEEQLKRREAVYNRDYKLFGQAIKKGEFKDYMSEKKSLKDILISGLALFGNSEYAHCMDEFIIGHWCLDEYHTFIPILFMTMIFNFEKNISDEVKSVIKKYMFENADISMADSWDFTGVNDNTPAMIAASLILGGEYYNQPEWVECGKKRFYSLLEMLERREFLSEFSSPTYTPITIAAVAAVAEWSDTCKELALKIEEKLWKQYFMTTYLPVCGMVGPYSRAYIADKLCITNANRELLFQVIGDALSISPVDDVLNEEGLDAKRPGGSWLASYIYHCPQEYTDEFLNRKYPYFISGKAELSSSWDTYLIDPIRGTAKGDYCLRRENILREDSLEAFKTDNCFEYPCAVSEIFTYMTKHYAMGTCTLDFHSGAQTDSFAVHYTKNGEAARAQEEIGAIYANYCINCDYSYVRDYGRKIAFQSNNHAMVLYSPTSTEEDLTQAKLSIYFSNYKNLIEEIYCSGKRYEVSKLSDGDRINIGFGAVSLKMKMFNCRILPLVNEKDMDSVFMEMVVDNGFLIVEIFNYRGAGKKLSKKEMRSITNGFVFNIESAKDMTFDEFLSKYENEEVSDSIICNVHNRYTMMREVKYRCNDIKLSCCVSPVSSGIKYINAGVCDKERNL